MAAWGCEATTLPRPPDLGAILALYDAPDGALEQSTLAATLVDVFDTLATLEDVDALRVVSELAADLDENPSALTEDDQGQNLLGAEVHVAADVRYRCAGEGETPTASAEYGTVDLTALASLAGLEPTLWGTIHECTEQSRDQVFTLTGDVTAHLLGKREGQTQVLIVYDGEVHTPDGARDSLEIDFQRMHDDTLRVRQVLEGGGSVIVEAGERAPDVVRIRDRQGVWRWHGSRASLALSVPRVRPVLALGRPRARTLASDSAWPRKFPVQAHLGPMG